MQSGFGGGGVPDFYSAAAGGFVGRSMAGMNNNPSQQQQQQFRGPQQQLPGIFLDPASQIVQRSAPSLIGKRTLSEFQALQQNQGLNGLLLRSVKPRMYNHASPISPLSPLSPVDVSTASISQEFQPSLSNASSFLQQRCGGGGGGGGGGGLSLLQQLRPHHAPLGNGVGAGPGVTSLQTLQGVPYMNCQSFQNRSAPPRLQGQDSENKMLNRLQELEKQLLDDIDEEGDAVSGITNTNEWTETIQNLISPSPNNISPSPTSSSSSSSSASSSVASPAPNCSKQSLMEAASGICEGKTDAATEILARLAQQVSNPRGNSEQRLVEYMVSALKSRLNPAENPPPVAELFSKEHAASTQLLYDHSPCFKLGFMAANLAILEAAIGEEPSGSGKIHVIDFDIGQGNQYMNFLHALSAKQSGKPSLVKITTVAEGGGVGEEKLRAVGEALSQQAHKYGMRLRFNVVSQRVGDLSRESLGCEADEVLAVNLAFKLYRMPDESVSTENPRDELLRRVRALGPRVVTVVEQEANTNTAPFAARVGEACAYYGALLESIESTLARDNPERLKVEEGLARRLANAVACEGRDRVERCEVFGKWRARLGMAGFQARPLSHAVGESMRARLASGARVNPGFTVKEDNGGLCFGWMGRTLTVASAWR